MYLCLVSWKSSQGLFHRRAQELKQLGSRCYREPARGPDWMTLSQVQAIVVCLGGCRLFGEKSRAMRGIYRKGDLSSRI